MRSKLEELQELDQLKKILQGSKRINTTGLEQDFLKFSTHSTDRTLKVHLPKLYSLGGEQHFKIGAALAALGLSGTTLPEQVDIAGASSPHFPLEAMILLSLEQINADHYTESRSYLTPLLEKIYSEGSGLLRDFTTHEAILGKVACKRGNLDLKEAHLFPEKFTSGPYTLTVELDTPTKMVRKFREITAKLQEFEAAEKKALLHRELVEEAASKALELRKVLGALSRYENPQTQTFSVGTSSCFIKNGLGTCYYLYSPNTGRNLLVYFGKSPFEAKKEPEDLLLLNGEDHQYTLAKLVKEGLFEPSPRVLALRIQNLEQLYEDSKRSGAEEEESFSRVSEFLQDLKNIESGMQGIINPEAGVAYALRQPPELLEFMVCPSSGDPLVHELLSKVSWNGAVRAYHHTEAFTASFEAADFAGKKEMLQQVASNLFFSHQQNNAVNTWLYQHHQQLCLEEGIRFGVQ